MTITEKYLTLEIDLSVRTEKRRVSVDGVVCNLFESIYLYMILFGISFSMK